MSCYHHGRGPFRFERGLMKRTIVVYVSSIQSSMCVGPHFAIMCE